MNPENEQLKQNPSVEHSQPLSRTKKALLGASVLGATAYLALTGGGAAESEPAPDPNAPVEDVVELPDGRTVEIVDDKYRKEPSAPLVEAEDNAVEPQPGSPYPTTSINHPAEQYDVNPDRPGIQTDGSNIEESLNQGNSNP